MAAKLVLLENVTILKLTASGEKYVQVRLISPSHGIISALKRRRSKGQDFAIDLFDQGEAKVELKPDDATGFLTDFVCARKRSGIGKSYKTLEAASWLSNFLLANPIHDENRDSTSELAQKAFDALDAGLPSCAVLLKTLFVYSRDEGYPIVEDWARNLDPDFSAVVKKILNTPLVSLDVTPAQQQSAFEDLVQYIERHTHIYLGNR